MMATRESKKKGVFAEEDELMFSDGLCNKGLILPESGLEVFAMAATLRPSENRKRRHLNVSKGSVVSMCGLIGF